MFQITMYPARAVVFGFPLLFSLSLPLAAQGKDPMPPSGGFKLVEQLDQPINYKDGAKTRLDVRYPEAKPNPGGWPVVVYVHALGLDRKLDAAFPTSLATLGYVTATYDVRGHGEFNTLNPTEFGTQIVGQAERLDLVEIVDYLIGKYGGGAAPTADRNRLGIAGRSQGGAHAWAGAAWSGRRLPGNSRGLTTFPVFKVACAAALPPFTADVVLPGWASVHNSALAALFLAPSVRFEKEFGATMKDLVGREDYAGAARVLDQDPFRQDLAYLRDSTVPVMAAVGWNDSWAGVDKTLEALAVMPAATPKRAALDPSTAHDVPTNDVRNRANEILFERWLARFLKDDHNGVDTEARFETSLIQPTTLAEMDPKSLQWTRQSEEWPPATNQVLKLYLREGGVLSPERPNYIEQPARVDHNVATGFDLTAYQTILAFALLTNLDMVTALKGAIPFDSEAHDTQPLAADMEIAGSARVRLQLDKSHSAQTFQVHASLFQVDLNDNERMLGSGMAFVQNDTGEKLALNIHVVPMQFRLRKGDRIRLRIENLSRRSPGGQKNLWVAPYFVSASFDVHKGPARPSHLDLPLRPVVQPALATATQEVVVSQPTAVACVLSTPTGMVGNPYQLLFSVSGHGAGIPIPGSDPLRLQFDVVTTVMLNMGAPVLVGGNGQVPGSGTAMPTLNLQNVVNLPAALLGLRLSAAGAILTKTGFLATNPQDLFFR